MTFSSLTKKNGQKLAYFYTLPQNPNLPTIMFLGGFKSDMTGTKAIYLEEFCRKRGQGFVRFDYRGHGVSDGEFTDGTIGAWAEDAKDILENIVKGDVILVGSSMGGWISLLLLLQKPEQVKGVVGIAAAPDFTEEVRNRMSLAQHEEMERDARIVVPSAYGEPYIYTKALVDEGTGHLMLHKKHYINAPLILLQGKKDDAVHWKTALRIKENFVGPFTDIIFIEDGDHRLSRDEDLEILGRQIARLSD